MQDSTTGSGSAATPGTLIGGRYRIVDLIGRGGMASVYRAQDETLGRPVALKLFAADGTDSGTLRRETSEIRLLASMNHHSLVTLFDANVDTSGEADRPFLVMELVEGTTLQERIEQGPVNPVDVAYMAVDLGEALHTVQGMGVVHRDIKPANILLSPSVTAEREFRTKLADFGIAYLADSTRVTTPGTIIGTAAYVSPEQAQGHTPGAPSDIYSLGLVLLEALTGVRSFPGTMIESLTARLMRAPGIPDSVGPGWKALLGRMTALQPEARPTALQVAAAARPLCQPVAAAAADAATAVWGGPATETAPAPAAAATRVLPIVDAATAATAAASPFPPPGQDAATVAYTAAPAAATAATQGLRPSRPAAAPQATPTPRPATPPKRRRAPAVLVVVLLVVLVAVGALIWWLLLGQGGQAPDLPAIDGPLGVHLEDLMEGVTP